MAVLDSIKTDASKETSGVWVTYPGSDIEVLVARFGNPGFEKACRVFRETQNISPEEALRFTDEESRGALAPIVAQHLWLDTKNLEQEAPTQPAQQEGAVPELPAMESVGRDTLSRTQLFRDAELRDFCNWILRQSQRIEIFRKRRMEKAKGN